MIKHRTENTSGGTGGYSYFMINFKTNRSETSFSLDAEHIRWKSSL